MSQDDNNQVTVRNCADWISYTAQNYDMEYDDTTYNTTCTPLLFLEFAKAGHDNLNPHHPLSPEDAGLIPANILPALRTSDAEYKHYTADNMSMGMLAASGDIQLSSAQVTDNSSSVIVTCTAVPECEGLTEKLTEVARGDFLHDGSRQILVRRVYYDPNGHGLLGDGTVFFLFSRSNSAGPYQASVFSLYCKTNAKNLEIETAVPCLTDWP